jgi:hypothetical protein
MGIIMLLFFYLAGEPYRSSSQPDPTRAFVPPPTAGASRDKPGTSTASSSQEYIPPNRRVRPKGDSASDKKSGKRIRSGKCNII